jgi:hypothetical protein
MMKRLALFTAIAVLCATTAFAAPPPPPPLIVEETDGGPSVTATKVIVDNNALTDNGDGSVTIDLSGAAGGQAITLQLEGGDDPESADLGEITIVNDTNSIFTESAADTLQIDVSANWPTADEANAGDSATAFFDAGTIEAARLPVASGSTAGIAPTSSGVTDGWVLTVQGDESVAWEASTSGVTTATALTDVEDLDYTSGTFLVSDGDSINEVAMSGDATLAAGGAITISANAIEESMLKAVDAASDEDVMTYESTTGDFEWHSVNEIAAKITAGALTDLAVVEDDLAASLAFDDGDLINLSGITQSNDTNEGLILPTWANVTVVGLTNGAIAWDETTDAIKVKSAAGWQSIGASAAPTDATYITQTADATLTGEQALGALASGILYSTTTTGVVSIATESQMETTMGIAFGDEKGATSGDILVGDGTDFEAVAMSGDATIASGGALTIAANAVESSMVKDNEIVAADLNATNTEADNDIVTYDSGGGFTFNTPSEIITAGTNISWSTATLNVDDAFLINSGATRLAVR